MRPVAAVRARAQLAAATSTAARRWAAERGLAPDDELSYLREYEHITLARILARHTADRADPSADDAIRLLERLLAAADDGGRTGSVIEILLVLALAHQARGDQTAAFAALEQALARAEPEGYVRVFVDELPAVAPLLRAIARHGVAVQHARRVLAVAPATAVDAGLAGRRDPPGSRRRAQQPRARRAPLAPQ